MSVACAGFMSFIFNKLISTNRHGIQSKSDFFLRTFQAMSTFETSQKNRRLEALKSVLFVYTSNQTSLLDYCQNYGKICSSFFFSKFEKQYSLIEFSDENSVKRLLSNAIHFPNDRRIPMDSRCLFYQNQRYRTPKQFVNLKSTKIFNVENYGVSSLDDDTLKACKSIELQMITLYKMLSMSELDIRLRYFLASEVEQLVKRLFPESQVHLFGSSVCGLGRFNGDVDMNLTIENIKKDVNDGKSAKNNFAYYISKLRPENDRTFSQHILECFGTMLKYIHPQIMNVRLILRARVPIVKFIHTATDIECDLCFGNLEALEMSNYVYRACHHHRHILPLIFTIRQWAKSNDVSRSNPGPWLSNFMLTLLIIFYLQRHETKLLPPLKFIGQSGGNAKEVNLRVLLMEFFKFYSHLDLSKDAISTYEGCFIERPVETLSESQSNPQMKLSQPDEQSALDSSSNAPSNSNTNLIVPLYLENPIERELNAAKNVCDPNLVHFQKSCQRAYEALKTTDATLLNILTLNDIIDEDDKDNSINNGFLTFDDNKIADEK